MKNLLWSLFAWTIGTLFVVAGIEHIFFKKLEVYKQYNAHFGMFAIFIGLFIIYSWFKQRR